MELPEIGPEERTSVVEALLGVIRQLLDRVGQLEQTNQPLREEIAVLNGHTPRPDIKPSTLETKQPTTQGQENTDPARPRKRSKNRQLTIHHEVHLHPDGLPPGATFKGFEPYVVQDLVIKSDNTRYVCVAVMICPEAVRCWRRFLRESCRSKGGTLGRA